MTASLAAAENVSMEMGEGECGGMCSRCGGIVVVVVDTSPVSGAETAAGMS